MRVQRKHPSALGSFDEVAAAATGKRIVMFMDYDGTLSPIVTDPDMAFMTAEVSDIDTESSARRQWRSSTRSSRADNVLSPPARARADEGGRARRRQALPHGDRDRPVRREGSAHSSVSAEPHCTRIVRQHTRSELTKFPCSFFAVQVCSFVGLSELYYAGSHGMDIKGPSSKVVAGHLISLSFYLFLSIVTHPTSHSPCSRSIFLQFASLHCYF